MRHLNQGRKLNRTSAHRKALFRNMFVALLRSGRIRTTDAKAKELKRVADRMVTLGKRGDLAARRRAFDFIRSHQLVKRLFDELAPRFNGRNGGYTRVVKFGFRRGDAAPLSIIEFVSGEEQAKPKKRRRRKEQPAEGGEQRAAAGA